MAQVPMTPDQLHEIAVRRRGDADVKALLLEVKRLRGVLFQAHEFAGARPRYDDDLNAAYIVGRLVELLEEEPAIIEPPRSKQGTPVRSEPEQHFPQVSEREEKRLERERR